MQPIMMPPNVIEHFYLGGERIAELRGFGMPSPRRPEEWLAATTHRAGEPDIGPSRTPAGEHLADLISQNPIGWLGNDNGPAGDSGLLVKLLDAGQRLPVHVHPSRDFAHRHLNCPYGKTEAWFVLGTSGQRPSVWLGWNTDVDPSELSRRVEGQDSDWMLTRMNRIDVRAGDGILVPAGTVHAIGEGVFVTEVQEPTDLSILLEWSVTTATKDESHLGLGMPVALSATDHRALVDAELSNLIVHTDPHSTGPSAQRLLPERADPYFRLDRLAPSGRASLGLPAGFSVGVVLHGSGILTSDAGDPVPLERGQVLAIPAAYGDWTISGDLQMISCRPGIGWPSTIKDRAAARQHSAPGAS